MLRLFGWLLFRLADRTLVALFINDPPRSTRLFGLRPLEVILANDRRRNRLVSACGLRRMAAPTLQSLSHFLRTDLAESELLLFDRQSLFQFIGDSWPMKHCACERIRYASLGCDRLGHFRLLGFDIAFTSVDDQ